MVWPAKLSCDYSYNEITLFGWSLASGQDLHAWVALAALLALSAVALVAWRRDRGVFFFLGFAAAAFLPTANVLVPIGTIMAERLMYLPLVGMAAGVSLTLAAAGQRLMGKAPVSARRSLEVAWKVAAVAAIAALLVRTVARNEDWTSNQRLWSSSAEAAPNSVKVIRALATIAMESDPSGGRAADAADIAMRGVRITEQAPLPLHHMPAALFAEVGYYYSSEATQLAARGESAKAHDLFGKAVALLERAEAIDREINRQGRERLIRRGLSPADVHDTGTASIYRNLGGAYLGLGAPERAVEVLSYMVHVQPSSFDAFFVLARAEGAAAESERVRGNVEQASVHLERAAVNLIVAILLNPDHEPSWQTLEHVYAVIGPLPGAILPAGTPGSRRTLDVDHPVVQRHFREACVELVRRLAEGGFAEDAARWRQRMIHDLQVPPETFDSSRGPGRDPR
jgi:tetratricopeptide (TPR) repeat protein